MMTVRFPTGFSVQYNDANLVRHNNDQTQSLYRLPGVTGAKEEWLANVPANCIVEGVRPCRMYDANAQPDEVGETLLAMLADTKKRHLLNTYTLSKIKLALRALDARAPRWKD